MLNTNEQRAIADYLAHNRVTHCPTPAALYPRPILCNATIATLAAFPIGSAIAEYRFHIAVKNTQRELNCSRQCAAAIVRKYRKFN